MPVFSRVHAPSHLKRWRLFAATVFLAGFAAAAAQAAENRQTLTAGTLHEWCRTAEALEGDTHVSPVEAMKAGYCTGFMKGYSLALFAFEVICLEDSALQTGVLIETFVAWADAHPELLEHDAEFGVTAALQDRLSCRAPSSAWRE